MLPFLLLPLLLFADFVSASQYLNTDGGLLHNSAVYQPQRRLTSDAFPSVNSNVTFITRYSKPKTTGLTDLVAWDRYSVSLIRRRKGGVASSGLVWMLTPFFFSSTLRVDASSCTLGRFVSSCYLAPVKAAR